MPAPAEIETPALAGQLVYTYAVRHPLYGKIGTFTIPDSATTPGVTCVYDAGGLVTHRGGLWLSLIDNTSCAPGSDVPGVWRLIVKSGGYNH
jgi:hypothetical protein